MPNTAEAYRQAALLEYQTQLKTKLASQHVAKENEVPIHGNATTFNLGELLYSNILESRYFFKILYLDIVEFEDVMEEIKNVVRDLEPLVVGSSRHPSSAFCILYLLACKRLTYQEVTYMLHSTESPFIRGLGFLYLRFALNPRELWKYFAPYFDDEMTIIPFSDKVPMTIGRFALSLIENKRYQSVILPMIPVSVKREWDVNVLKLAALENRVTKPGQIHAGDSVMGFYGVDLMWYPAKVLKVINPNSYWIIYETYNNKEIRSRGHILMNGEDPMMTKSVQSNSSRSCSPSSSRSPSRSRSRSRSSSCSSSRSSHHHSRHHSSHSSDINTLFDDQKLAELVRERERNAVVTSGRAASSVGHVKQSMMLKMDKFTTVKTDDVPERNVVVKKLEVADSVEKMRAEAERKKREEENRKRLEAIQRMYTKNQNDDKYNHDYV